MTNRQLLAYITNRLNPLDWTRTEDIATAALALALQTGRPAHHHVCDLIRQRATGYLARLTPPLNVNNELAPVIGIPRPRTPRPQTAHLADVA